MNVTIASETLEALTSPSRLTRKVDDQPIDGYRLLEPLGVGGFGEVWKCLAPGDLLKAIKIVTLPPLLNQKEITPAQHERAAMDRIKQIRHPFLISVDRVDASNDELFVVMELADASLRDEFDQNRSEGRPGIPEQQLLHYLLEAAEVLDLLNFQHGLQHLDVKPGNLLVVNRHVKLADFGLVSSVRGQGADEIGATACGVTPRYASPELMQGRISRSCDQYSLAIVYQELLTGELPFQGNSLLKRLLKPPTLDKLPEGDRPVVARALSANPEERFSSCLEFMHALLAARAAAQTSHFSRVMSFNAASDERQNSRAGQAHLVLPTTAAKSAALIDTQVHRSCANTPLPMPRPFLDSRPAEFAPFHVEPEASSASESDRERSQANPSKSNRFHACFSEAAYPPILHILELEGGASGTQPAVPSVDDFIAQLVAAKTGRFERQSAGQIAPYRELPDQVIEHSFPMEAVAPLVLKQKLEMAVKECRGEILFQSTKFISFAVEGAVPLWNFFSPKQTILKIAIKIEAPCQEQIEFFKVTVRIEPMYSEGAALSQCLINIRSLILRNIRSAMQVVAERRMHERWPCNFGVKLHPILPDGQLCRPIDARAGDLSPQGIGLIMNEEPVTNRVYIRPKSPKVLSDYAILSEIVRQKKLPDGSHALGVILGRF